MKVSSVAILAAVSMIFTSFSVWSLTGKPRGEPPAASGGPVQPLSGGKTPSFARAGTLELEGRLGHAWLPAGAPTETFLLATVRAPADGLDSGRRPSDGLADRSLGDLGGAVGATPVNLSIVIDRSGSMKGKRLSNALDAARGMLRRVRDGDVVSIIAYDTRTETLVPPTTIDDSARQRIAAALGGIRASGDTCISCGIDAAMATLRSRSDMLQRILLLSDGEPTAGVRDIEGFRRIAAVARGMNCPISSIGVDVDYNERLLSALALDSNGSHYFAENAAELERAFESELRSLARTVGRRAELELQLSEGVELDKVFDRTFRREGRKLVVPLGDFSAGDERTVLLKLRLPTGAAGALTLADVLLRYDSGAAGRRETSSGSLVLVRAPGTAPEAPLDALVAARLGRTETADALEQANGLFNSGDLEGARLKLRAQRDGLAQKKATFRSHPGPLREAADRDIDKQEKELDRADRVFGDAPASAEPGQAPKDTRAGKAGTKRNVEAATPLRR